MRASDQFNNSFEKSHDQQIGNTLHDEIVMWLYARLKRDRKLVSELTGVPCSEIVETSARIEAPIEGASTWRTPSATIGFADLKVSAGVKAIYLNDDDTPTGEEGVSWSRSASMHIEVKSKVNLGETIRQINYYCSKASGRLRWAVCAPAFEGSEILEEHGIAFIEYQEDF